MNVQRCMTRQPLCVSPQTTAEQTLALMDAAGVSTVPVCDSSRLVGMMTRADLLCRVRTLHGRASLYQTLEDFLPHVHVAGLMTLSPATVGPKTAREDALAILDRENLSALPVVDAGLLVGIVTRSDLSVRRQGTPTREANAA